jgi:type IV pilus assembly protein PilC
MKPTCSEIAALCRELAVLLHSGIGIADGIFLLAQTENDPMGQLLLRMGGRMDEGAELSEAMEETGSFPGCVTGMIHVGEQTGRMEEVLRALAQFYDQRSRSNRRIRKALGYPAALLALMILVIGMLLIRVLPVFDDVYASLGSRLTGVAAALLHLGQLLKGALPVLWGILAAAALAGVLYACCAPLHEKVNRLWTARFGDRGFYRKFNNANFARALALGLRSALVLEEAVEQAAKLLADNPGAAARCCSCAAALRAGKALSDAMAQADFLPPAESRMLAVGLRQGSGDAVMEDIADRLMEEAEDALEDAVAKAEPVVVLSASVLVGFILLSVMLPLMNIMTVIG